MVHSWSWNNYNKFGHYASECWGESFNHKELSNYADTMEDDPTLITHEDVTDEKK